MANTIPIGQASPIYTTAVKVKFDELNDIKVNNFFRSFFPALPCPERYPIIEIRRGSEKIAIDVQRGHQGTRTQISKSTQKAFDPFYYKYYSDATELKPYFRVFGSNSFNDNDMADLASEMATLQKTNQDLVERAIELHCATVMENGTCTSLRDGSIVDFKRQAASMVDLGGSTGYWTVDGTNPYVDLRAGCDFIKQKGKYGGVIIHAIFGTMAWQAYRGNTVVKDRLKEFNNKRDIMLPGQRDSTGADYQGTVDCDGYIVHCWTYNDVFDDPTTGVSTPYMNPKKVNLIADNALFKTLYGAIPQIAPDHTASLVCAPFVYKRAINTEEVYDRMYVESSPLPVPATPDRMFTLTVVS